jgi:hypothetical protein
MSAHLPEIQRAYGLMHFKQKQEEVAPGTRINARTLSELFNQQVKISAGEKVSENFAEIAIDLHDTVLQNPKTRALVLGAWTSVSDSDAKSK